MFAAKTAAEVRDRMVLLGAAAYWPNKAFDLEMERFQHLREMADGEGLPGRGEEDISDEEFDTDPRLPERRPAFMSLARPKPSF